MSLGGRFFLAFLAGVVLSAVLVATSIIRLGRASLFQESKNRQQELARRVAERVSFALQRHGDSLRRLTASGGIKGIRGLLTESRLGETGVAALVDDKGRVLLPERLRWPDAPRIETAHPIRRLGWWVRVSQSESELNSPVRAMVRRAVTWSLLAAGAVAVLGAWLVRGVLKPIRQLGRAARALAQGTFDHRIPDSGRDELATVAHEFNLMADRLKDTYAKLTESNRQLNDLSRLKSDFVSQVSHEIRGPLTSIKGFTETLLAEGANHDEATTHNSLQIILEEADRLARLVDNLLNLARIESGRTGMRLRPVLLSELVRRVLASFLPQAGLHTFVVAVPETLPLVEADGDQIARVLTNLVGNALKYSPAGAVTVSARERDGGVEVSVDDEGPGIPPERRNQVFEKFERLDTEATRHHPGTGLGLTIARAIVEAHGGTIRTEAGTRGGARFAFILKPAAREAETERPDVIVLDAQEKSFHPADVVRRVGELAAKGGPPSPPS